METTPESEKNDFLCTDDKFRLIEQVLIKRRPWAEDVWERRINLSLALAESAHTPKEKKFQYGILCYLGWLFWQARKAAATMRDINVPPADFLIHIEGNASIEVDTLIPVARALRDAGQSVVVLFGTDENVPVEITQRLQGIPVIPISANDFLGRLHGFFLRDAGAGLRLMAKAFVCLFPLRGSVEAFWKRGVCWLDILLRVRRAERFWQQLLGQRHFKGVAVASEFAPGAEALCRVAKSNSWPVHHFLHGLPSLQETRGVSTDVYCYSQADRDFFLRNGWTGDGVHALGHPRQCGLIQRIQQARTSPPGEGGLRLLFASQPPSPGGFESGEYEQTVAAVLGAAAALGLTSDEFRVRLHPMESREQFLRIAASRGLACPEQWFSRRPISEDLAWANVVMTPFSTMAIESAYADCLLIWLSFGPFRYEIREQLISQGYGQKAGSTQQLAELLARWRDSFSRSQSLKQQLQKARELHILNDRTAAESAALMLSERRLKPRQPDSRTVPSKPRIESLDYLRGLLAFSVMIYHYNFWTGRTLFHFAEGIIECLGIYAVSTFYILSGASLAVVYGGQTVDPLFLAKFAIKRVLRIAPLFWCASLFTLAFPCYQWLAKGTPAQFPPADVLWLNFSLLFSWLRPDAYFATGAWSIGNELFFYSVFPVLLIFFVRSKKVFWMLVGLAFLCPLYVSFRLLPAGGSLENMWTVYIHPFNQGHLFASGAAIGLYRYAFRTVRHRTILAVFFISAGILATAPAGVDELYYVVGWHRVFFTAACLGLCWCAANWRREHNRVLAKAMRFLGITSYSIYLLHPVVFNATNMINGRWLGWPQAVMAFGLAVPATLLVSSVAYAWIEKPAMDFASRLCWRLGTATS